MTSRATPHGSRIHRQPARTDQEAAQEATLGRPLTSPETASEVAGASRSRTGLRCWLRCLWRDWLLGRHDLRLITVSVRYASAYVAQHSPCLHIPRPPVVPPTFGIGRSRAIPGIECVSVVLAHLLLGGQTLTELVEYQIGTDRRNAAYKDHKHPFHASRLPSCQPNRNGEDRVSTSLSSSDPADSGDLSIPPSDHGSSHSDDGHDLVPNHAHARGRPSPRSGLMR